MEHSEQLDKLAIALSKAQSEMSGAVKDSSNPFFKSKYADLTSVWVACKDALHNNGFSVIQAPITDGTRIGVSTMLLHSSGQFVKDSYTLGVKKENDPQADGSSITYARRYALAAFVGVCPVDDDAESAMSRKQSKAEAKPQVNHYASFVEKADKCTTEKQLDAFLAKAMPHFNNLLATKQITADELDKADTYAVQLRDVLKG